MGKVGDMQQGKRNIILTPDQLDDDEVIEILESNPTYTRDKKIVDRVRNLSGTMSRPDSRVDRDEPRGNIDFVS